MTTTPTWVPIYACKYPDKNKEFFDVLFAYPPFLKQHNFIESECRQQLKEPEYDLGDNAVKNNSTKVLTAITEIWDLIVGQHMELEEIAGTPRENQNEKFVKLLKMFLCAERLCWPQGGLAIGVLGFRDDSFPVVDLWTFDGMEWCNNGKPKCINNTVILSKMPLDCWKSNPDFDMTSDVSLSLNPSHSIVLEFCSSPGVPHLNGTSSVRSRSQASYSAEENQTPLPVSYNFDNTPMTDVITPEPLSDRISETPQPFQKVLSIPTSSNSSRGADERTDPCPAWFLKLPVPMRQELCKTYHKHLNDQQLDPDLLTSPSSGEMLKARSNDLACLGDQIASLFKDAGVENLEGKDIQAFIKWRRDFHAPGSIFFSGSPLSICDLDLDLLNQLPIPKGNSMKERFDTIGEFLTQAGQIDQNVAAIFPATKLVTRSGKGAGESIEVDWKQHMVTQVHPDSWADTPRGAGVQAGWYLQFVRIGSGSQNLVTPKSFEDALNSNKIFTVTFSAPVNESPIIDEGWQNLVGEQRKEAIDTLLVTLQARHREECWQMLRHLRPIEQLDNHKDWIMDVLDEIWKTNDSLIMPVAMSREFKVCDDPKVLWLYIQFVSYLFNLVIRQHCQTCVTCGEKIETDVTSEWRFMRVVMTLWLLRLRSHASGKLRMDREETCTFFGFTEQQYQWFFTPTLGEVASLEVYQFENMNECLSLLLFHLKNELTILPELLQDVYKEDEIQKAASESLPDHLPAPDRHRILTRKKSERMNELRKEYQYTSVLANWANSGQAISRIDSLNKSGKNAKKNRRAKKLKVNFRVRYQFRYNQEREGYQKSWGALKRGLIHRKREKLEGLLSNIFDLSSPLLIEDIISTPRRGSLRHLHEGRELHDMPCIRIMHKYFGFPHIFGQCDPIVASIQQYNITCEFRKAMTSSDEYPVYDNRTFFEATGLQRQDLTKTIRMLMEQYSDMADGRNNDLVEYLSVRDFTQDVHKADPLAPKILHWQQKREKQVVKANGERGADRIKLIAKVFHADPEGEGNEHADHHPNEVWHHFRLHNAKCPDVVDLYAIINDQSRRQYYVVQEFGDEDLERAIIQIFNPRKNEDLRDKKVFKLDPRKNEYALQDEVFLPFARQLHAIVYRLHNVYKSTHNDLKPKNIVLCPDSADMTLGISHRLKLIDFGQMMYFPPVQRYFMLNLHRKKEVMFDCWRSFEHCGTPGYWSIEKHHAVAPLPDELDTQKFPPKRITIPDNLLAEFAEEEDSDSDDSDSEEEVQAVVDNTINVYDSRNRHDRISSDNFNLIGYEARKAELFALAMTYWWILVGEKPFTSVEHAFVDRKEWEALMKFTDGAYLKVGGDSYNFSEFLAQKMSKKSKLRPDIIEYIRRLTLPEPDRQLLKEENLDNVLSKIREALKEAR